MPAIAVRVCRYDLRGFAHPGGPVALSLSLHREATALFEAHHPFSRRAKLAALLKKYEVDAERAAQLDAVGVDDHDSESPYVWAGVNPTPTEGGGADKDGGAALDPFETELKAMAHAYFSAEAARRGISLHAATKATPQRWLQVALLGLVFAAAAWALVRGESKRLVVESPWSQFTSKCQRF
jgi:hypothetical protein